jgi:surface antigen
MTMLRAIAAALAMAALSPCPPAMAEGGFSGTDIAAIQAFAKRMLEDARTGSSTTWRNGDGSVGGRVTITSTDHQPGAQPCRTYEWTMRREGGAEMTGVGRGCRKGSGDWSLEETRSERQSSIDPPSAPEKAAPSEARPDPASAPERTRSAAPAAPKAAPKAARAADVAPAPEPKPAEPPAAEKTPAERLAELSFTPPPRTTGRTPARDQAGEVAQ